MITRVGLCDEQEIAQQKGGPQRVEVIERQQRGPEIQLMLEVLARSHQRVQRQPEARQQQAQAQRAIEPDLEPIHAGLLLVPSSRRRTNSGSVGTRK